MSAPAERVGAIVLAAGESKRFGAQKLLAPLRGRPLVQHVVDAANASSLDPIVIVLGADADDVEARLARGRARVVRNADYASGQASTLRAGLRAIASEADAAVVVLGDQPFVSAAVLERLVARQRATGAAAVLCAQRGRRSPPALLHRDVWSELEALSGDVGARDVLAPRNDVAVIAIETAIGSLDDVDTVADWERLRG